MITKSNGVPNTGAKPQMKPKTTAPTSNVQAQIKAPSAPFANANNDPIAAPPGKNMTQGNPGQSKMLKGKKSFYGN